MYEQELKAVGAAAQAKVTQLKKEPLRYIIASLMGGFFVGFGVMLIGVIGGILNGQPYVKIVIGFAFTVALSLIVMAGGELFTGNNMVMAIGAYRREVSWTAVGKIWIACYVGNWIGSIIAAAMFVTTGTVTGEIATVMGATAAAKMAIPPVALFVKAIMCNMLVCIGVWCTFRCKSETAKLIMLFWCIFTFNICGFEHSVANMTYLTVGLLGPVKEGITVGGYFYNIIVATAGNLIGGAIFTGLPFYIMGKRSNRES